MNESKDNQSIRRLFDDALSQSLDALFEMPDVDQVVSAVADGNAAILISSAGVRVVPIITDELPAGRSDADDSPTPGMYL